MHHALLTASILFFLVNACHPVATPNENSRVQVESESLPIEAASGSKLLLALARMTEGNWQVTFQSGTSMQFETEWGPGNHSVRQRTGGEGAAGEPWRAKRLVYWHPGMTQVRLLSISPYAKGVSEGEVHFDGEDLEATFDLYQEGGVRRDMGLRWVQTGRDLYRMALLESTGPAGMKVLVDLEHVRTDPPSATHTRTADEALDLSEHWKPFQRLLGQNFEFESQAKNEIPTIIQSNFEWIPHADFIQGMTLTSPENGEPELLRETTIYYHTGADELRFLALSASGAVDEGEVSVLKGGAIQFDSKSYEGDQVESRVMRFDIEEGGDLRQRLWSVDDNERALMYDSRHKRLEPK